MKGIILSALLFGAALSAQSTNHATIGRGSGKSFDFGATRTCTGTLSHRPKRTASKAKRYRRRKMAEISRRANLKH